MVIRPQERKIAIISYLTVVGTLIAASMNSDEKSKYSSFHIRQALGLSILFFSIGYFVGYFNSDMISFSFLLSFSVLWIYGFVGALNDQQKEVPVLGKYFQQWFNSL